MPMRTHARAVVIGGGVGGASILYWLARLGWTDTALVERARVTSGSTFHSAGLVGQLRGSLSLTRMMMNSVDLYRNLRDEVGLETGWHEVGSLRLASSAERMEELARQAGWAKTFGLPLELISADEAQRLFPPMSTDRVLGAAYLPTDGYIDPSQLTFALVEGARRRGAEICEDTRVTSIEVVDGEVRRVITDKGAIETELVVNAGGMFAPEIGRLAGVVVPIIPMAHEYLITKPSGLRLDMPTMRDPSLLVYFRPESGGLVMGGYERDPAPWGLDGIPADFNGRLLTEDWDRFDPLMQNAIVRVPSLKDAQVVRLVNGPEAFTPDGEFILGPSEVHGFWVAAGFCAHGLAGAGGMGRLVAEWIVNGRPEIEAGHRGCRESAGLFDFTSFAKIEVRGSGAASFLERLCDNQVARGVGRLTYTQMLNDDGGIECDFTVTRLAGDRFRIVTGTAFGRHDLSFIREHASRDGSVQVEDVTSAYACIGLWGPKARTILHSLTPADVSNAAFPYMTARDLAVGPVPLLAVRATYGRVLG